MRERLESAMHNMHGQSLTLLCMFWGKLNSTWSQPGNLVNQTDNDCTLLSALDSVTNI